jgi:FMN reductase
VTVAIVVGNPKPRSRTFQAANLVAEKLTGAPADFVVDLADVGEALLDWSSPQVAAIVNEVAASDIVIFATPTYKGTFTGLLKLFLDRVGTGALAGKPAVAMMLGGEAGLFLLETDYQGSDALDRWVERARPLLAPWTAVA